MNKEDFIIYLNNLHFGYWQFCLNQILHAKVEGELYTNFRPTWNIILRSLESAYLLGLANVLEHKKEPFYKAAKAKHSKVVDKIFEARKRLIAHLDVRTMRKEEDFLKANALSPTEIQAIFDILAGTADRFASHYSVSKVRYYFDQTRNSARSECYKWLRSMQD